MPACGMVVNVCFSPRITLRVMTSSVPTRSTATTEISVWRSVSLSTSEISHSRAKSGATALRPLSGAGWKDLSKAARSVRSSNCR